MVERPAPGAVLLASSDKTPCQAFRYGDNAYALQFHIEVTRDGVAAMAQAFAGELDREKISADEMIAASEKYASDLSRLAETVFSRWAAPIQGT